MSPRPTTLPATAASRIASTPEEITPELVTELLSARFPGCEAVRIEVVDAHSGTTGRARLRIGWKHAAGAPVAVFAKLAPTDPMQREMVVSTGMGRREARFYAGPARAMPVRVAEPYASVFREDGTAYLMLIEDLAESGCAFPTWKDPDIAQHAAAMMDSLAKLHAAFQGSKHFEEDLAWIEPPMRSELGPLLVKSAVEQFGRDMPPAFHEMAELYIEHTDAVCDRLDAGPATLLHGDSHLGNLFLDRGEIGFLDWACAARAPGVRDVAYFLSNSIPTDLRRKEERNFLARYRRGLLAAGGQAPSDADLWQEYRLHTLSGWVAATATAAVGSRMQPIEIGMRSMQRSTDAITDLATPELFRAELGVR